MVMKNIKKSLAKLGAKNPMWRGDEVGYIALHEWVRKRKPKPRLCERCKKKPPLDLANKGIYNRNLNNWEWICRRCHMVVDGRIKNLKVGNEGGEKHPMFGKHHSEQAKRKMAKARRKNPIRYWKGKHLPDSVKKKMSIKQKLNWKNRKII